MFDFVEGAQTEQRTCEKHGEYTAGVVYASRHGEDIWSTCPECRAEYLAAQAARNAEAEREREAERLASRLRNSGIPLRFRDRSLDNFATDCEGERKALRVARAYAERFESAAKKGTSLIFCGLPGTGKTHLACAIASHVIRAGYSALFINAIAALRRVKATYSKDRAESEEAAIEAFRNPRLLILDEIGVQFGSETERQILFEIINGRYEALRPTILVSNEPLAQCAIYVGDRVMDRMKENGGAVLSFDWPSRRATANGPRDGEGA